MCPSPGDVSQPGPFADGRTVETVESDIEVASDDNRMFRFPKGVTLNEIVRAVNQVAVNQVGASPGDLVAILESLKQVGALSAELIVI
jgi:flagellar P-ring protein precursor FlgI